MIEYKALSMPEQIELQQQLHKARARVARFEKAILAKTKKRYSEAEKPEAIKAWINALVAIANESPQQSLAHIQADAVESFEEHCDKLGAFNARNLAKAYAQTLRDKE